MHAAVSWITIASTLLAVGCGSALPLSPSSPSGIPHRIESPVTDATFGRLAECSSPTYVGPIRLPISVHGTTATFSWPGNPGAIRGYELQFEIFDVTNTWLFSMRDVTILPETSQFLRSEGTYRVRVRGLFCNDQTGPFTDWNIFSTDDTEIHQPTPTEPPPPIIVEPPVVIPPVEPCDLDLEQYSPYFSFDPCEEDKDHHRGGRGRNGRR